MVRIDKNHIRNLLNFIEEVKSPGFLEYLFFIRYVKNIVSVGNSVIPE